MPVIDSAVETTQTVTANSQLFAVTAQGSVVVNGAAFYGATDFTGITVVNNGLIYGTNGLNMLGASTQIYNYGQIGGAIGIAIGGNGSTVHNSGQIMGYNAFQVSATNFTLINSGTIEGTSNGIFLSGDSAFITSIENTGTIIGRSYAILAFGTAPIVLRNSGLIQGNVSLGNGDNVYNGLEGRVSGTVYGGNGIDIFYAGRTGGALSGEGGNDTLYGAEGNDILNGGTDNDILNGGDGNDTLNGASGDDVLNGGNGADTLNGGLGADRMTGGSGDDLYYVDNIADIVIERANGGDDIVYTSVNYALAPGVHVETLAASSAAATTALELTGNALAQTIIGNAGDNRLRDGAGAADLLQGLGGNDTYVILNSGTQILEAADEGTADRVLSYVSYTLGDGVGIERLMTNSTTGTAAIDLTGNDLTQLIIGNAGANRLDGKGGADTLTGGDGADIFIFSVSPSTGVDKITDFAPDIDKIALSAAIFGAAGALGTLAPVAFWANTTGLAHDSNDRIIYDSDDGRLYYDPDGTGTAARVLFATLGTGLALGYADFVIV